MRVAVLMLGLAFALMSGCQSCAVYTASSIGDSLDDASKNPELTSLQRAATKPDLSQGTIEGAGGLLVSFLLFVGAALVFATPIGSAIAFGLAALLAFGNSTEFKDLAIWGFASGALAVMALFSRKKREPPTPAA